MPISPPRTILSERSVAESRLVHRLRRRLPAARFEIVERLEPGAGRDPNVLEVVRFRGRFLRACPGTRNYHCCGYQIVHFGTQCSIGCTYCILQAYFQDENLRLFGNLEDLFSELTSRLQSHRDCLFRIGSGEFTDSLLLDPWTDFSADLVRFFAGQPNAVLELKTKTDHIHNLEGLDHAGHTIVAWSLNAASVRAREETGAASIAKRLQAAGRVSDRGYRLAFHFDPMIDFPSWREEYAKTLDRLFAAVDAKQIVWISLGAFRFMPILKDVIRARCPQSRIPYGEFIRGLDGKMRYFRDIRVEMYRFMADRIRRVDPAICVYLCMESDDVWRDALGFSPLEQGGLAAMLDRAVQIRMGIGADCTRSAAECLDSSTDCADSQDSNRADENLCDQHLVT